MREDLRHDATRAITEEETNRVADLLITGFKYTDASGKRRTFRPNAKIAMALQWEYRSLMRISDVTRLKLSDYKRHSDGLYYLDKFREQKTGKKRTEGLSAEGYLQLVEYADMNGLGKDDVLFNVTPRAIQKGLKIACDHLGLEDISTHSYRKRRATEIYYDSGKDIELVARLLNHSNVSTTRRYIGITPERINDAFNNNCHYTTKTEQIGDLRRFTPSEVFYYWQKDLCAVCRQSENICVQSADKMKKDM